MILVFWQKREGEYCCESIIDITAMSRITQTTMPVNTEVRRIFCAYHPQELLTNFCCDSNCLMPLCPNCIVQHTEQHFLENNRPIYVNIHDAISETKQKCYQHIVVYEELGRSNDKLYDYAVGLRESIHNQLMEDKQEIFRELDLLFENYEEKLISETLAKYKESEVYDKKETASIGEFIQGQIEQLQEQISVLKGDNCLAGLITYYAQDAKSYEQTIKQIGDYLQKHRQAGRISINTNVDALTNSLNNFCENNLQVQHLNEDLLKQKQQQSKSKESSRSRETKSFAGRLALKQQRTIDISKENNLNHSNHEYRNMAKRTEDYHKIDASEMKFSRNSKPTSTYTRPPATIRHHY